MGPVRTCVGCRRRSPVTGMVRVARLVDGALVVDRTAAGRGAWLCGAPDGLPQETCMTNADRTRAFARAFRAPVEAAALSALRAALRERARMVDVTVVATREGRRD
jgi:predicted RNA-binding protein YlxR (DUF448 family)